MLNKLKLVAAAAIGVAVAIFAAFRSGKTSATNEIKAKSEVKKAQTTRAADAALYAGLKRQQEIKDQDEKDTARNFFE